ncbi:hypothetical protein AMECASPLE_013622 [Ameca splendens]|uniref:Uncharacterized protein n=1 Tax=Ameca splendens TaxID=208324 RepID=A0ABV0ZZ84_9TELE
MMHWSSIPNYPQQSTHFGGTFQHDKFLSCTIVLGEPESRHSRTSPPQWEGKLSRGPDAWGEKELTQPLRCDRSMNGCFEDVLCHLEPPYNLRKVCLDYYC